MQARFGSTSPQLRGINEQQDLEVKNSISFNKINNSALSNHRDQHIGDSHSRFLQSPGQRTPLEMRGEVYKSPSGKYPYQSLVSPKNSTADMRRKFESPSYFGEKQLIGNSNSKSVYELERINCELRLALQQSMEKQRQSEELLHQERTRSFETMELKRRLEEELSKMEFELDRISSYDNLNAREMHIKAEAAHNQNARLHSQISDLQQELKQIKKQHRDLMTDRNKLCTENAVHEDNNKELLEKVEELNSEISHIRNQLELEKSAHAHTAQQREQSRALNRIETARTENYDSNFNSRLQVGNLEEPNSLQSHQKQSQLTTNPNSRKQLKPSDGGIEDVDHSHLLDDYNRLLHENMSMKKLYKEFYQQENSHNQRAPLPFGKGVRQKDLALSEVSSAVEDSEEAPPIENQKLQTFQKNQLSKQINHLREDVVNYLMQSHYLKVVKQSTDLKGRRENCLVLFIKDVTRNIQKIDQMVINYLMARDILKKELGLKRLPDPQPETQKESEIDSLLEQVKQSLKKELKQSKTNPNSRENISTLMTVNINAYFLALFRILTVIHRYAQFLPEKGLNCGVMCRLKHYCLKYIHKIIEEGAQTENPGINPTGKKRVAY